MEKSFAFFVSLAMIISMIVGSCIPAHERAEQYLEKGIEQVRQGNHLKAIEYYSKAIELSPEFSKAYTYRGSARYDLKDFEGAKQDYTRAIELDPFDPDPYDYRGRIRSMYYDYEGACEDFKKAEALGKPGMYEKTRGCP